MNKSVKYILLFLYIYNIAFAKLPLLFRSRIALSMFGTLESLIRIRSLNKIVFNITFLNLLYTIPVTITFIHTGNLGLWFIQHGVLNILYLFGGLFVACKCNKCERIINEFLSLILYLIVFHNFLSLIGFLVPSIGNWFIKIQNFDIDGGAFKSIAIFRSRFSGLGVGSFFTGGIISGLGIILNLFLIRYKYISLKKGVLIFTFLLVTGMFIARTTLVGLVGLLLYVNPKSYKRLLHLLVILICFGSIATMVIVIFLSDYLPIDWAFEVFINIVSSDKIETSSTNELINMWRLPNTIETWFFGDGLFFSSDGAYYMHTDVGYLRIIYCIGIPGLMVFIINQLYLFYAVNKLYPHLNTLIKILALFILILNIKGFAEINFFFYLIIGYYISYYKVYYETSYKHSTSNLQCRIHN